MVLPFLSFKGMKHVYLPLLNLLVNCISVRSAPQILFIKDECTILSLKFLITVLSNSSANSLFEIFSF